MRQRTPTRQRNQLIQFHSHHHCLLRLQHLPRGHPQLRRHPHRHLLPHLLCLHPSFVDPGRLLLPQHLPQHPPLHLCTILIRLPLPHYDRNHYLAPFLIIIRIWRAQLILRHVRLILLALLLWLILAQHMCLLFVPLLLLLHRRHHPSLLLPPSLLLLTRSNPNCIVCAPPSPITSKPIVCWQRST